VSVVDGVYYTDLREAKRQRWSRMVCRIVGHRWGQEHIGHSIAGPVLTIRRCERCLGVPA
jgi:hypothetical protein